MEDKPPAPPKPIKEDHPPWFALAAASTIAALTLMCLAEAGQGVCVGVSIE
jgi:hypothetical protein